MSTTFDTTQTATRLARRDQKRRGLLKLAGSAAVLGVLVTAGCAPADRDTASSSTSLAQPTPNLAPGDTSNGADNFYTGDRVTVQEPVPDEHDRKPVRTQRLPSAPRDVDPDSR